MPRIGAVTGLDVIVEIAFGYGPLDASPVWTDVSDYWMGIRTRRGRNGELREYQPGSLTVRLKNTDRRFDPTNLSGPYVDTGVTEVLPLVPIRVTATHNAVTYPIFYGFVDRWQPLYAGDRADGTGWAAVDVEATDAFKVLDIWTLPDHVYAIEVLADSPVAWWRLDELAGTQMVDSSGNNHHGDHRQGVVFNRRTSLLPSGGDNGALYYYPGQYSANEWGLPGAGTACTFECWVQSDVTSTDSPFTSNLFIQHHPTAVGRAGGILEQAGTVIATFVVDVSNYRTAAGDRDIMDGSPHHVVATRSGNTVTLYIDGAEATVTNGSAGSISSTANSVFGEYLQIGKNSGTAFYEGAIDEAAYYDTALSAARVEAHYNAAWRPWYGDTTGERIGRVLDQVGWPAGLRDIDTGETVLGSAELDRSPLALARDCETAEQGALFVARDGDVRFVSRATLRTAAVHTTAQVSFGDAAGEVPYQDIEFDYGDTDIYNTCEVTTSTRRRFTYTDATSEASYGPRTLSLRMPDASDAFAQALAEAEVLRRKDPGLRASRLRVSPVRTRDVAGASLGIFASVLGLEVGYRAEVNRRPPGGGTITEDVIVERIVHNITPESWSVDLWCSPADPNEYAIVGTSLVGGSEVLGY